MAITINVLCYKYKTLSNGEHPIMVRICKDGKKKYVSVGISVKLNIGTLIRMSQSLIVRTENISAYS